MLKTILTSPIESNWGERIETKYGPYWFQNNGSSVLGVAHLDSVMIATPQKYGPIIFAPQLDDRLGVWCLLRGLPRRGINLDILLTTNEERMNSTAQGFIPPKQYNWIMEFDRAGVDIVTYQYGDFDPILKNAGFKIGRGSYSDIVELEHLNCLCANIGIGYHNQHTRHCFADLRETNAQLDHFADFYRQNKDTNFAYNPDNWLDAEYNAIIKDDDYADMGVCDGCGKYVPFGELSDSFGGLICPNCLKELSYV